MRAAFALSLVAVAAAGCGRSALDAVSLPGDLCVSRPVDPLQASALGPSTWSHWLQPWRAWNETLPGRRMQRALGLGVPGDDDAAKLATRFASYAAAGLARAQIEATWTADADADAPDRLREESRARLATRVRSAVAAGLRPLLLLHAPGGAPSSGLSIVVVAPAAAGARELRVDDATARAIVPGRSGFAYGAIQPGTASRVLFTSVGADGTVTLSQPLPAAVNAATLRGQRWPCAPWRHPTLASGAPDPEFELTQRLWSAFVTDAVAAAREAVGGDGFDVELWNEMGGQAAWLDVAQFYDPLPAELGPGDFDGTLATVLARTVAALRAAPLGFTGGVGNGFANSRWQMSAAVAPAGLTALDRHLSVKALRFPGEFPWDPNGGAARSIDALGLPNGGGAPGAVRETFSPRYDAYLPELPLAAIGPKPLFRDLAPFETIGEHGERHGRSVAPLELWVSAYNLNVGSATALGYALPPALLERVKAKSVLRAAAAFVGKGASALVYYAPDDSDLALYDPAAPGGGAALRALARLTGAFAGAELDAATRTLSLVSIGGCPRREEWSGDGTAEHPSLYDHDVLAFLPFQLAERRFAVAAYVMTRNVLATRDPRRAADDPARFDLAPARYRLTVRGLGPAASVRAIDPLPDVPAAAGSAATIVGRVGDATVVDAELTDAPRLLLFED